MRLILIIAMTKIPAQSLIMSLCSHVLSMQYLLHFYRSHNQGQGGTRHGVHIKCPTSSMDEYCIMAPKIMPAITMCRSYMYGRLNNTQCYLSRSLFSTAGKLISCRLWLMVCDVTTVLPVKKVLVFTGFSLVR